METLKMMKLEFEGRGEQSYCFLVEELKDLM